MHEFASLQPDPRLAGLLDDYPTALFSPTLYRSIELADRYCLDLSVAILGGLGVERELDNWRSTADLVRRLHFPLSFQPRLRWLLRYLTGAGVVAVQRRQEQDFYRKAAWRQPELERLRTIGLTLDPANAATLDLLAAAAAAYPAVAAGGGEEALLGGGNMALWLAYFHNDNPLYAVNNRVAASAAARRLRGRSSARILEVGAGAGSSAEALLQALAEHCPDCRIEQYRVTEPSPFLRRRAERMLKSRFRDIPLQFAALDIDQPWFEQGAPAAGFDLVYAVNVLHIAYDLRFSLRQARASLAADGWLIAGECLRPFAGQPVYIELAFQLLDSFATVLTDLVERPSAGFLTPEHWRRLLAGAGFEPIELTPEQERIRTIYPRLFVGALCGRPAATAAALTPG